MLEIPIWYQDHVSGDWWSQETGVVQVSQEEEYAYEADCNGPPPSSEEQANDVGEVEDEPDQADGVWWLRVLSGKGTGRGRITGSGKKGGRFHTKKGKRMKGGKGGPCHICGQTGHWKRECPNRKGRRPVRKGAKGSFGKGPKGGFSKMFGKGKAGFGPGKGPVNWVNWFTAAHLPLLTLSIFLCPLLGESTVTVTHSLKQPEYEFSHLLEEG